MSLGGKCCSFSCSILTAPQEWFGAFQFKCSRAQIKVNLMTGIPNIPNYHMILWIAKFVSKDVAWKRSSWSFKNQEKHLPMEWSRQQNPLDVSVFISFLLDDSNPNIKKYLKRICPKSPKKLSICLFLKNRDVKKTCPFLGSTPPNIHHQDSIFSRESRHLNLHLHSFATIASVGGYPTHPKRSFWERFLPSSIPPRLPDVCWTARQRS